MIVASHRVERQYHMSGARQSQQAMERCVGLWLFVVALAATAIFLPSAGQAQDFGQATSDIRVVTADAESADAVAAPSTPAAPAASAAPAAPASTVEGHIWPPAGPAPTPERTGILSIGFDLYNGVEHPPSQENLWWAIVGGAGALLVHAADKNIEAAFANASWTEDFFALGDFTGAFRTLVPASVGVYAVGRSPYPP